MLVVDDLEMNLTVFEALLKRTKMNIVTVNSGKKCLELMKKESFHIVFLDHMMPEMDGIETLHEIQKLTDFPNEETPVIALTANALSGMRETYLQEGFKDFLTKPIDAALLEQMILSYLPKELVQIKENIDDSDGHAEEDDQEERMLARLKERGFYIEEGLDNCQGNKEFYKEVLRQFAEDMGHSITGMDAFLQKEDAKNYEIIVHGLKSSSNMIGANTLSDMAKDLEDAANKQNLAYIRENHEKFLSKYRETVQDILDVIGSDEEVS